MISLLNNVNSIVTGTLPFQRKSFSLISLFFLISFTSKAQLHFNSENLKSVFALLPDECKNKIIENGISKMGSFQFSANISNTKRAINYRINKYGEIAHLGLYLINENQDNSTFREVFDYLERAFLVSALLKEKFPLDLEVEENNLTLLYNGKSLKESGNSLIASKIVIDNYTPFRLKYDSNFFCIDWIIDNVNKLQIKIPNNYSLITKKTKDELELDLMRRLKDSRDANLNIDRPLKNQLIPYLGNVYLFKGESYYASAELNTSKYYFVSDSIYPVNSIRLYKESIRNLFLNIIPTQVTINITQKLYGGKIGEFNVNINRFFSTFSPDYTLYFGWQNEEKENLKASIFISSKVYNFNHLLEVNPNNKDVFTKVGAVKGVLYAFIPKESLEGMIFINNKH